jgi:NitT/TauT family transport system ATP-binding protein
MPALIAEIREKRYPGPGRAPGRLALAGLSLSVAAGEFAALVGPSGCGKTTFLNIVSGLDRDFAGKISLAKRPDGGEPRIGYVFQNIRLLPWRTVRENIALVLRGDEGPEIAQRLLEAVGLGGAEALYPRQLSIGMRRRAAIARAFAIAPDLLLMDEPFVSLDRDAVEGLHRLLLELWQARPTTVLFVSHDLGEALRLADRIFLLSPGPGRVVEELPVALPRERRSDAAEIERLREAIARRHRALIAGAAAPRG